MGLAARAALALIRAYKYLLSPWFTGACRFVPTCGDYTAEAIARHGLVRGSVLAARRLSRCQPLGGHGHDPVPLADAGGKRGTVASAVTIRPQRTEADNPTPGRIDR